MQRAQQVPAWLLRQFEVNNNTNHGKLIRLFWVQRAQRVSAWLLRQFWGDNNRNHGKLIRLFLVQHAQLVPSRLLRQFEVNNNVNHHRKLWSAFVNPCKFNWDPGACFANSDPDSSLTEESCNKKWNKVICLTKLITQKCLYRCGRYRFVL